MDSQNAKWGGKTQLEWRDEKVFPGRYGETWSARWGTTIDNIALCVT